MSNFAMPVELYMTSPVRTMGCDATLEAARDAMGTQISSVAVVDEGRLAGVVTRTDLLREGTMETGRRPRDRLLELPSRPVSEVMTSPVATVSPTTSVREAGARMAKERIHRLFVVSDEGALVGVLSTKDVMRCVGEQNVRQPITTFMSTPVFTVRAEEPIALATERLDKARVSGLVVVENGWPVGVFTQRESLVSAALDRATAVEEVMSPALLCMHVDTPTHRAAAQAAATTVRRVIAIEDREMRGILTGLDFARVVAGGAAK